MKKKMLAILYVYTNFFLGPNGSSKTSSLSRMGSKEKLLLSTTSTIVTVISPQMLSGPNTSDEMPEETKSDYLRRTNSSSSIVTLGVCCVYLIQFCHE